MTGQPAPPPAGWYPDPSGSARHRWWDGRSWTADVDGAPQARSLEAYAVPGAVQQWSAGRYVPAAPVGLWRSPADDRPAVAGMGDAVRVVLSRYAAFDGRASRAEFWYLQLFVGIISASVLGVLLFSVFWPPLLLVVGAAYLAVIAGGLALLLPSLAVSVRRLRDAGFHWAWIFLSAVPFGGLALLVMWAQPSKYP